VTVVLDIVALNYLRVYRETNVLPYHLGSYPLHRRPAIHYNLLPARWRNRVGRGIRTLTEETSDGQEIFVQTRREAWEIAQRNWRARGPENPACKARSRYPLQEPHDKARRYPRQDDGKLEEIDAIEPLGWAARQTSRSLTGWGVMP
jgi:hypothetical protein